MENLKTYAEWAEDNFNSYMITREFKYIASEVDKFLAGDYNLIVDNTSSGSFTNLKTVMEYTLETKHFHSGVYADFIDCNNKLSGVINYNFVLAENISYGHPSGAIESYYLFEGLLNCLNSTPKFMVVVKDPYILALIKHNFSNLVII